MRMDVIRLRVMWLMNRRIWLLIPALQLLNVIGDHIRRFINHITRRRITSIRICNYTGIRAASKTLSDFAVWLSGSDH